MLNNLLPLLIEIDKNEYYVAEDEIFVEGKVIDNLMVDDKGISIEYLDDSRTYSYSINHNFKIEVYNDHNDVY